MPRKLINTDKAPAAIGTYLQAVRVVATVYLSGQIPLVPATMLLRDGDMRAQITQVFENLKAVAEAAGGSLNDIVKLNVYLTALSHFPLANEVMAKYFAEPYPARAAVGVAALPKGAAVEADGVMVLNERGCRAPIAPILMAIATPNPPRAATVTTGLHAPLTRLKGVGPRLAERHARLGIHC